MAKPVPEAKADAKYNVMDKHLQVIIRDNVSLDDGDCKEMNAALNKFLSELFEAMKQKDEVFRCLFKQSHFLGSYYENLRVKEPNEFDINLELRIPDFAPNINIVNSKKHPGFAFIEVKSFDANLTKKAFGGINNGHERKTTYIPNSVQGYQFRKKVTYRRRCFSSNLSQHSDRVMSQWLDSHGYLMRDSILKWLQGVVDKGRALVKIPGCEVNPTRSGPAITLEVIMRSLNKHYSVDLVPVISFGRKEWPKSPIRPLPDKMKETWFLVPKGSVKDAKDARLWRMSFSLQERQLILNKHNMKPNIKLLKLLRDIEKWNSLSSYYIKTLFLWEFHNGPDQWQKGIGQIFMHMLKSLQKCMENKKGIPYYWDARCELTAGMSPIEKQNIANRLTKIISKIDQTLAKEPDYVKSFFKT